jgi:hypothetical protein
MLGHIDNSFPLGFMIFTSDLLRWGVTLLYCDVHDNQTTITAQDITFPISCPYNRVTRSAIHSCTYSNIPVSIRMRVSLAMQPNLGPRYHIVS